MPNECAHTLLERFKSKPIVYLRCSTQLFPNFPWSNVPTSLKFAQLYNMKHVTSFYSVSQCKRPFSDKNESALHQEGP